MTQVFEKIIHLENWQPLEVGGGLVLLHQDEDRATLVEIDKDNKVTVLRVDDEPNPAFDADDARLIARVVRALKSADGDNYWNGSSPVLPVAFYEEDLPNPDALVALAYCWHSSKSTLIYADAEDGLLYHVHFDGGCWFVALTAELELDYIVRL